MIANRPGRTLLTGAAVAAALVCLSVGTQPAFAAMIGVTFDDPALQGHFATTQFQPMEIRFGYASDFGQPSPGRFDCGPPLITADSGAPSPPQVAKLLNCSPSLAGSFTGTFAALSSSARSISTTVHMTTTCDGPCFAPVRLDAYDKGGTVVATASARAFLGMWTPLSVSQAPGEEAAIRFFAIYREDSWEGSLAIDNLSLDIPSRPCSILPIGLIAARWHYLDGKDGPLGCPTEPETDLQAAPGKREQFEHGQVVWAPDQGAKMVVAAYQQDDNLIINWGPTSKHYDKFQLAWQRNGVPDGDAEIPTCDDFRTNPVTSTSQTGIDLEFGEEESSDAPCYIDRTFGFYRIQPVLPGRYSVGVEGCVENSFFGFDTETDCDEGWTAPATVDYQLPLIPFYEGCNPQFQPTGLIAERWAALGGGDGIMGCPLGPESAGVRSDSRKVRFQNGEIVTSPLQGEAMTVAAYQDHDWLHADWGDSWPHSYEFFLVRWHRNGVFDQQRFTPRRSGTFRSGHYALQITRPGDYSLDVLGCDDNDADDLDDECEQGATAAAHVEVLPPLTPLGPPPPPPLLQLTQPEFDTPRAVSAALALKLQRARKAAELAACGHVLRDVFNDEDDWAKTAIAKLYLADDLKREPGRNRCPVIKPDPFHNFDLVSRFDLVTEVNDSIRSQGIKSEAGTEIEGGPQGNFCPRQGEYDVALKGYIPLAYRYKKLLAPDVRYRLLHLLTKRGPHDEDDESISCGLDIIPESENHELLIESSRYLTNQLWAKRTSDPYFDNNANQMKHFILEQLQHLLQNDFVEYNARPYARYSWAAIQNLYDYAEDPEVKQAAEMVLDYLSAKMAISTSDARRNPPFRRLADEDHIKDDLLWVDSDPMKDHFLIYTAPTLAMHDLAPADVIAPTAWAEMVLGAATTYQPPALILDLIVNPSHRTFFQVIDHAGAEAYSSEPDFLITAGGVWTEATGAIAGFGRSEDEGVVQRTFVMPTGQFTDVRQMIRFGDAPLSDNQRVAYPGMCVAPRFACGLDPDIPPVYTSPNAPTCWMRSGPWTFIDFASDTCKDANHREFGFYAAVYGAGTHFGFVEVVPKRQINRWTLAQFEQLTLQRNGSRTYDVHARDLAYTEWDGSTVHFDPHGSQEQNIRSTGNPNIDHLRGGTVLSWQGPTANPTQITITNHATSENLVLNFAQTDNPMRIP